MKKQCELVLLSLLLSMTTSCAAMHKSPPSTPPVETDQVEASAPVEVTPVVDDETAPAVEDTTPPMPVVSAPPAEPSYVDNAVYFKFDKYNVEDDYDSIIRLNSHFLNNQCRAKVIVSGNTDRAGSVEYNLALGQRRANSVKRALISNGVNKSQIETVSLGKAKMKFKGDDEGKNRRVDIIYKKSIPDGYSMNESGIPQIDEASLPNNNSSCASNLVTTAPHQDNNPDMMNRSDSSVNNKSNTATTNSDTHTVDNTDNMDTAPSDDNVNNQTVDNTVDDGSSASNYPSTN